MHKTLSYYTLLFLIRLKGIKKAFSQSPINYLKLRSYDVFNPTKGYYKTAKIESFSILKSKITQLNTHLEADKLLLYFHGGAFVSGPAQYHWDAMATLSKNTKHTIWVCNYPKAPECKIDEISTNVDQIYQMALTKFKSENIILMGDSAGGTLVVALTQRLFNKQKTPSKIVLISPLLDASLKNTEIDVIDKNDPILAKIGLLSALKMCSDDANDVRISPINGQFKLFPKTYLFLAENDITFPDQLEFVSKLEHEKIDFMLNIGQGMPHIWPLIPVMKASKVALNQLITIINE